MKKISDPCLFLISFFLISFNSFSQDYSWVKGSSSSSVAGTYGTQNVAAMANNPGGRHGCATWSDASGNLWLFGGEGFPTTTNVCWLNDLWKFTPSTNEWTWISGANTPNDSSVYGLQGVPSVLNHPGAREFANAWTDAAGNFWMFGGDGFAATSTFGRLADLWKYDPQTNQWTWMGGQTSLNANGIYGTQGLGSTANYPGARYGAATWADASGKLWMLGGRGFGSSTQLGGFLNDLWSYDPGTGEWTWESGGQGGGISGIFGSLSVPAAGNCPGGRVFPCYWLDANGNLVLFGGQGYALSATPGFLNEMWVYNLTTGYWTWISGSSTINQSGIYGVQGIATASTVPGGRASASGWKDDMGNYWIFGGNGIAQNYLSLVNDLWKYDPLVNKWTWIKGGSVTNQNGTYGTMGVAAPANTPGAREHNTWWKTAVNNDFWLFGGEGYDASSSTISHMNDLWKYAYPCNPDSAKPVPRATICSGNSASLAAYNELPANVNWYSSPSSTLVIGTGSVFATPVLTTQNSSQVFTYYAQANACTLTPRAVVNVTVIPTPTVTISGPVSVCPGDAATLTASGAASYSWNTGAVTASTSVSPVSPGITYVTTGSSANGCPGTAAHTVTLFTLPVITASSAKSTICADEVVILTAFGGVTYTWTGSQPGPTVAISPTITTSYTVEGTDVNGCTNTHTLTEFVAICEGIAETANDSPMLKLYPNPSNGSFTLQLSEPASLVVTNALGQIILSTFLASGNNGIALSASKGVYTYRLLFKSSGSSSGKLVIE